MAERREERNGGKFIGQHMRELWKAQEALIKKARQPSKILEAATEKTAGVRKERGENA